MSSPTQRSLKLLRDRGGREVWRAVPGYEGVYEVSDRGRARSLDRVIRRSDGRTQRTSGRVLKPVTNKIGYPAVILYKNGEGKRVTIHRLVAAAFLPPDSHRNQINHIDADRGNNRLENLERCTSRENVCHAMMLGRHDMEKCVAGAAKANSKPVEAAHVTSGDRRRFKSTMDAERNGFSASCVQQCCKGKIRTHRNYVWRYL